MTSRLDSKRWALEVACRGMAIAASVASLGNLVQVVLDGAMHLVPATVGGAVAAVVNLLLIRPIHDGRPWAGPTLLWFIVGWVTIAALTESEAGMFLYVSFGSVYVCMIGQIATTHPRRWLYLGPVMLPALLVSRHLVRPVSALENPAELAFCGLAGGVGVWAVTAWVFGIVRELEHANEALGEARDDALEANAVKDRFLANMSHELRTPLNAIGGYADLLLEEAELDDASRGDLHAIRTSAHHLSRLLTSVLDLSRIEGGVTELHLESVDVGAVVAEVEQVARPLARERRDELTVSVADDLDPVVTDRTMLHQILLNLLSNACKFTEDGVVELTVTRREDQLVFVVADTGLGIPEHQLDSIFDRFVQADNSSTRRHDGAGLGLSLVQAMIRLLGGEVSVTSEVGRGSEFTVVLPQNRPRA